VKEEIGSGFARSNLVGAEDPAFKSLPHSGDTEGDLHLLQSSVGSDAVGKVYPIERLDNARNGLQVTLELILDRLVIAGRQVEWKRPTQPLGGNLEDCVHGAAAVGVDRFVVTRRESGLGEEAGQGRTPSQSKMTERIGGDDVTDRYR
jgi:hypothetical protein